MSADEVEIPIACTLAADDAGNRLRAWTELLARALERESTQSGVKLRFEADSRVMALVADLAVREAECCAFFSFTIKIDAHGAWLTVDAPPDGRAVLDSLFLS